MSTIAHSSNCLCKGCCEDRCAQAYVDAIAARDAMTPRDAAIAAGARTPEQIAQLEARIRNDREAALHHTA